LKKVVFLLLIFLLAQIKSGAQITGIDTLFRADEMMYFSDLERRSFHEFFDGNPDYLLMITAINSSTDERELEIYRDWITDIIENIRRRKFEELNGEKKIDRIKKYVSQALLITYKHTANFDDLFKYGNYNYFTAASIYAFILDQLEIPYEIHELPTHINITAYPEDLQISFETSSPGSQYFMFDHQTRSDFVDFIHDQGVIDDRTYTNSSVRDLFEQYYFAGYLLTIREMIGMLYINSAVDLMAQDIDQKSYAQLEKAFILNPSYRSQYLLLAELNGYLIEMEYNDPLYLGYLIKASKLIDYGVKRELLEGYLKDIINTVLVEKEDQEGFEYIYE